MISQDDESFINSQDLPWEEKTMNDFLPTNYEVPQSSGNYMKFKTGMNRFRILSSAILGYEWWVDSEDGKRQPMRVPMTGTVPVEYADTTKHFWAMVVYNHAEKRIQILEITQKSIQTAIKNTVKSKWGDPKGSEGYDFVVTREGDKLETQYTTMPEPKEPLDPKVMEQYKEMDIRLEALFAGEDPFLKSDSKEGVK